jgi:tetratricopeptide (TPR) repeat protein
MYNSRGLIHRSRNDFDRAIADYSQAIFIDVDYVAAYYNRGSAHYMKRDYARAIADYEATLRMDPNHENAKQFLELARQQK